MDLEKYRALFVDEARDHLQEMGRALAALEGGASVEDAAEAIDTLFRMAHSIKGMAASLEYTPVSELAHRLEDFMEPLRGGEGLGSAALGIAAEGIGALEQMVAAVDADDAPGAAPVALMARLAEPMMGPTTPAVGGAHEKKAPASSRRRSRPRFAFAPRWSTASWRLWVS